jgi:hypothetical protein
MKCLNVLIMVFLLSGCVMGKKEVVIHPLQDDFFQITTQSKIIAVDGTEKITTKPGYFMSDYYFKYVMDVMTEK